MEESKKNEFLENPVEENQEINDTTKSDLNNEVFSEETQEGEQKEDETISETEESEKTPNEESKDGESEESRDETLEENNAEELTESPEKADGDLDKTTEELTEATTEITPSEERIKENIETNPNAETPANTYPEKAEDDPKIPLGKKKENDETKNKSPKKPNKKLPFIIAAAIVLLIIIWPKHTHTWSEWQITKNATCTEDGSSTRSCTDCGEVVTKTLDALGHSFGEWSVISNVTCTENGSRTHICNTCGASETDAIAATGHSFGEWSVTSEATCIVNGSKTRVCSSCEHSESAEITAFGHDMADATCTAPKTCKNNCGHTEGDKLGHKNDNGHCSRCGEKMTIDINTVYINNDECSIKITTIDPYSIWGYRIYVQLENKSADKSYTFYIEDISVNGVMCSTLFSTTVAPGKLANDDITISTSVLEKNGIVDFTDIEISFKVYESGEYGTDGIVRETIHIYPYGEEKATKFIRESLPTDILLIDNEQVTITAIGFGYDSFGDYYIDLYIVNKTSNIDMTISVDDAAINGIMIDPFVATSVYAGKSKFNTVSWSSNALSRNYIEELTDIEISLRVYNSNDLLADNIVKKTVHIYPLGESAATKYVRESQPDDIVLVDNEYVTVTAIKLGYDSYGNYEIQLYMVNKTSDTKISITTDDEAINNFMMDPFDSYTVSAEKCKFGTIDWSSTTLQNNGITEVEKIEFRLIVSDYNDWSAEDLVDIVVTISGEAASTTSI